MGVRTETQGSHEESRQRKNTLSTRGWVLPPPKASINHTQYLQKSRSHQPCYPQSLAHLSAQATPEARQLSPHAWQTPPGPELSQGAHPWGQESWVCNARPAMLKNKPKSLEPMWTKWAVYQITIIQWKIEEECSSAATKQNLSSRGSVLGSTVLLKMLSSGTSLVLQGSSLHVSNAGDKESIPGQGIRFHMPQGN